MHIYEKEVWEVIPERLLMMMMMACIPYIDHKLLMTLPMGYRWHAGTLAHTYMH